MHEITANVNWLAVTIGFVLAFALGYFWYSPKLFGSRWAAGVGVELGDSSAPPTMALVTQAVGTFLLAWLVGVMASHQALLTMMLILSVLIFLLAAAGFFIGKKPAAIFIESGFVVAMAVIMMVCQHIF